MSTVAVFPGTFDPVTNGHLDLIHRASKLFDQIIVAIAASPGKNPRFELAQRIELVQQAITEPQKVSVKGFSGLLVDFVQDNNASIIVRGLRAVSDFEYEFQLANMNHHLAPAVETVFLTPAPEHAFLSSSLVREVASLGGNISSFVPEHVSIALNAK